MSHDHSLQECLKHYRISNILRAEKFPEFHIYGQYSPGHPMSTPVHPFTAAPYSSLWEDSWKQIWDCSKDIAEGLELYSSFETPRGTDSTFLVFSIPLSCDVRLSISLSLPLPHYR